MIKLSQMMAGLVIVARVWNYFHLNCTFCNIFYFLQVHSIIQSNVTDEGASVDNVCKQLRGVPERSVRSVSFADYLLKFHHVKQIYGRTEHLLILSFSLCFFYSREAIEFLSSEGHIYSTIDEDHYKATDS